MNKKQMYEKLGLLNLDTASYVISGDASLMVHGVLKDIDVISISCLKKDFNNIDKSIKEYFVYDKNKCKEIDKIKKYNFSSIDNYYYERELVNSGIKLIGGVDEVGRGPLVGPVVTACVVLPLNFKLDGLTDSKKLSENKREFFYDAIMKSAISVGIGIIDNKKIYEVNIYEATKLAMKEAINNCKIKPEHVLIDAMKLDIPIPTTSIVKGDLLSISISAASVIAKVTRDRMMYELDKKYPMYNFKNNKGYPTKDHIEAIKKHGIIKEHRKSFGPVRDVLLKQETLDVWR